MQTTTIKKLTTEQMELGIATRLVQDALASCLTVSVYDGKKWCLERSKDSDQILAALRSTDWNQLRFKNALGEYIGSVAFFYGNAGWDLIYNHTKCNVMTALMKGANSMADHYKDLYNTKVYQNEIKSSKTNSTVDYLLRMFRKALA